MTPARVRRARRRLRGAPVLAGFGWLLAGTAGAVSGCVSDGHPLGNDGSVSMRVSVEGALFATDALDTAGQPTGPRQTPYQTDVLLRIKEDTELAHGAFVEVRVEPGEALALGPALDTGAEGGLHEDGTEPTCDLVDGAFRCRANTEGAARFSLTSRGDWSGDAKVIVSWAGTSIEEIVTVRPAGLPPEATNFLLLGIADDEVVKPTFLALACSADALPSDLGDKWPAGRIRAREVYVRASAPADNPAVVENAPVVIESTSSEGALSLLEDCSERSTRLRVTLDATGQSPRFFACFSDLGGQVGLSVQSGAEAITPSPSVRVVPEPRLLRVRVLDGKSTIPTSGSPESLFEVSAYDVALNALELDVDLAITPPQTDVLLLDEASATLSPEGTQPAVVRATPNAPGTAQLVVSPRLLAEPKCASDPVTVTP